MSERILLLGKTPSKTPQNTHLSVIFAIVCIVDVFGVFPLVTLPKAIIDCGFYGILVVFIVCSIQMYTAIILGKCWLLAEELDSTIHLKNRYPYSALAEMTFGTKFANFVTCLLDVTIFAGGIPNLIVASQNLELLVQRLALSNNISYCYWMMVLGAVLCPFLWFGSPKDMKLLCSLSVCLVGSVFLLLCGCIIFDDTTHSEPQSTLTNNLPLWNKILTAYGVIVFQFDIHPTILTIQVDMEEKQKLHKAIFGGFGASLTMFTITSLCVAIKYGENVNLSLLESIPSSAFLHMCAFLVALQLGLTSTISNSALYQHMEDCLGISREFNHKRCIIRTALIVLAVLLAETVPRFDLVMAMIGGTLTGPIVFIFPPLFYIKMLYFKTDFDTKSERTSIENVACNQYEHLFSGLLETKDNQRVQNLRYTEKFEFSQFFVNNLLQISICSVISIVGICSMILMTYVNVINNVEYANFSQPCIYNVSLFM